MYRALFPLLLLGSSLIAQVPMPPHASVYNGYSRGFNFTAATNFSIAQLQLPLEAFQQGDTAGFLVRVNGQVALRSVGNANAIITTNIPIVVGDVVDVIGNWSPAVPANFTAHNSYGTGPYATVIEGVPHTLQRCGWQWDIADPRYTSGAYFAPTTGQIGRVIMWTSSSPSGQVFATSTPFGAGCLDQSSSFYENFQLGTFDLSGPAPASNSIRLNPTGAGGYAVLPGSNTFFTPTSANLGLGDDTVSPALPLPFQLVTPAGVTNALYASSNGYFWTQPNSNAGCCTGNPVQLLTQGERFALLWQDLNPAVGGTVHFDIDPSYTAAYITWLNVPEFGQTGSTNTFQAAIFSSGAIEYRWQACSNVTHQMLVGYSLGTSGRDPGSRDLATAMPFVTMPDAVPLALATSARPITGTTLQWRTTNVPTAGTLGILCLGFSSRVPPVDLGLLGAPGCFQHIGVGATTGFLPTGGLGTVPIGIPAGPALVNLRVYGQSLVLVPGLNTLGAITSNGVDLLIGDH